MIIIERESLALVFDMRTFHSHFYLMRGRPAGGGFASYRQYGGNAGGTYLVDPSAYHRGAGIGSVFSSIFSSVVPFIKGAFHIGRRAASSSAAKAIGHELKKAATEASINVVSDALKGKNILQSSKQHLKKVGETVGEKLQRLNTDIRPKEPGERIPAFDATAVAKRAAAKKRARPPNAKDRQEIAGEKKARKAGIVKFSPAATTKTSFKKKRGAGGKARAKTLKDIFDNY